MYQFLPVTNEDMKARGWEQVDFVYVTGDAYVDHSSFGTCDHQPPSGKPVDIGWESSPSLTGAKKRVLPGIRGATSWFSGKLRETWIPW